MTKHKTETIVRVFDERDHLVTETVTVTVTHQPETTQEEALVGMYL
ncbi:hypothetical protein [Nonomuraea soli]|uniref:Uncharacterized protein n=1 Tax=Nonomuraea soli TaxID=1032476 RepID=A0A7W0CU38_9ACTN|nr:hypothetical protein [Nonomuraea soli]MBA2897379.1 hypothetical protein [Nonomuraea soli]